LGRNCRWTTKVFFSFLMATVLVCGLVGCRDRIEASQPLSSDQAAGTLQAGQLSEVAPPSVIQQLSQSLEGYQPQVTILGPANDQVLQDTTVSVQLQVQDLPVFKDPDLDLGPHLHVILDNEPYQAVYDLDKPLVFENLPPGTHTLRVFASRPWHESFKNEGAYAQTTFHVFTKSADNNPQPNLPLLTYSRPKGDYGAEPIMLDFYLTNAPLHLVAQENPDDDIADWRIRVTINGESFVLDRWQPVYLKGFKPGKNWVKLEFLDEQGNPVSNVFNDTVRLINYEPKGKDTLSKLIRGELSAEEARGIVQRDYQAQPTPTPAVTPVPSPSPLPSPTQEPTSAPFVAPPAEETPTPEPETREEEPTPAEEAPLPETKQAEKPKPGGFFNRFRRPTATPSPSPEQPEEQEAPSSVPTVVPEEPEQTPEPEASASPSESLSPVEESAPEAELEPAPVIKPVPIPIEPEKPRFGGFFNRFQRPAATPSPSPEQPEGQEVPSSVPTVVPEEPEQTPEPEASASPSESPTPVEESASEAELEPAPVIKPVPIPIEPEKPRFGGFFNRFQRPAATPSPSPVLPEKEAPSPAPTPSESPTATQEQSSQPESEAVTPEVEESPVIEPIPVRPIQPEKSNGLFNRFGRPDAGQASPDSGLPPTLPEIVETPFPQPSQPEAGFPQPEPATAPEATPTPESTADEAPATSDSGILKTPNPVPAAEAPKLDLKEIFISPPTPTPSARIIQAPPDAASDIPSRYLKKSAPDASTEAPSTLEAPTADTETTDTSVEEEAIPEVR
jgi:hypothetical protein